MKRRRFGELMLCLLAWLMLSVLIVGSVFVRVTDTDAAHKLTLSTTAGTENAVFLAAELEEDLPAGIKMVKVRPFTYYMFGGDELRGSDVFLIRESEITDYIDWFMPLPEEFIRDDAYTLDGVPMGLPCAPGHLDLGEENWYLFIGKNGVHPEDGGAAYLVHKLINGGKQ